MQINLSTVDVLAVRITSTTAKSGRQAKDAAEAFEVYAIPRSALQPYLIPNLTKADQEQLTQFFEARETPKVEAAISKSMHIMDGYVSPG